MDPKQARALAERVLSLSKADEAEVSLSGGETTHLRFARNSPSTSGAYESPSLSLKSVFGKRSGSFTVNQFDETTLKEAVRRSEEIARLAPEDPEHMPALGPQEHPQVKAYFEETAARGPEELPKGVATCIKDAREEGLVAAGFTQVSSGYRATANSKGLFGFHRSTETYLAETARTEDGTGSGWAAMAGNRMEELDFGAVSKTAIGKARASARPKALEPGTYVTILEPACVASLVQRLLWSMDARAADEGRSYFAAEKGEGTRLGDRLFPESVTLYSDPTDPAAPSVPWGEDGLPQAPRTWIDGGTLANLTYSRYWAAKKKVEPVPFPPNAILKGGSGSVQDLIASTKRGVLVTSLWYIRSVDPRTLLLTGLTRDGVFWIEDGEIKHPVKNFRWNDSPVSVLKQIDAMSAPERVPPRGSRSGTFVVPALKVKEFRFSSVSDAV